MREDIVEKIGEMIGINRDEDRLTHISEFERLRNLLFFIMDDNDYDNLDTIIRNSNFNTTLPKIRKIIAAISKHIPAPTLPKEEYIKSYVGSYYDDEQEERRYDFHRFERKVKQAGMCCVMAFTGWRKSEFGFPLSSLEYCINHDVIDQYSLPYRHLIRWHVFKTQKGSLSEREITQTTMELILSLSSFTTLRKMNQRSTQPRP